MSTVSLGRGRGGSAGRSGGDCVASSCSGVFGSIQGSLKRRGVEVRCRRWKRGACWGVLEVTQERIADENAFCDNILDAILNMGIDMWFVAGIARRSLVVYSS